MEHREIKLENEKIEVRISCLGAELVSAVWRETGRQMIWQADPAVWEGHAPLLFPYCGRLFDHVLRAKGKERPAAVHGFARHMVFECEETRGDKAVFLLKSNDETREMYPYEFELRVEYCLQGGVLRQAVTVLNPGQPDGGTLPFALGFHPGFALTGGAGDLEWELAFEQPESPRIVYTPGGYVNGESDVLFENESILPLADDIFADDSLCLQGLGSRAITLRPRGGAGLQQGVRVTVEGFPSVLLWGPPQGPLPLVCIEPWHGLPDGPGRYDDFGQKPNLVHLTGEQSWQTALEIEFLG